MKKALFFMVILLISTCINFLLPNTFAYEVYNLYPLQEGNKWNYSVIKNEQQYQQTAEVIGEDDVDGIKVIKVLYSPENYLEYLFCDTEGLQKIKDSDSNEYSMYSPSVPIIPNLDIGQSSKYLVKETAFTADGKNSKEAEHKINIGFENIEEVGVPAGTFKDCLKFQISFTEMVGGLQESTAEYSIWFAPGVGKVKQVCISAEPDVQRDIVTSTEIMELISAKINGKEIGNP
jgi:hypothetical protein